MQADASLTESTFWRLGVVNARRDLFVLGVLAVVYELASSPK